MWSITFPHLRRALGGLLLLVALVLVGCKGKQEGTVSGTVKRQGKPVPIGSVQFINSEKGAGASGQLDSSGNYTLEGKLEAGTYKVYLQAPVPEQLPPGQVSKRPPFDIPPKYQDPAQTPFTKEVKEGKNEVNLDLPD